MKGWAARLGRCRLFARSGELLLVALVVGGLLWVVQAEHASLPVAARWADARIAAGEAAPAERERLVAEFRATYSWRDSEGRLAAYPVSHDSYYFLRLARNIVETGTPCPGSPPGEACRDTSVNPPHGRPMAGAASPHPWAIALVHEVLEATGSNPSMLFSGRLHNRLMLILCGLLVYLLVRGMAPSARPIAGLTAAVTLVLAPAVMTRSFGTDNDVWILALLLGGSVAAARLHEAAVEGRQRPLAAIAAGTAAGLLAATWGGWPFLLIMVASVAAIAIVETLRRRGAHRQSGVAVGSMIGLAGFVFLVLVTVLAPGLLSPGEVAAPGGGGEPPPDAFAAVAELVPPTPARLVDMFGWPVWLAAGVGLVAVLRRLWPWGARGFPALELLLLAWGAGALLLALRADRFLILLSPPLAMLAGLGVTALPALLPRPAVRQAVAAGIALALAAAVTTTALALVRDNRPQLNTAWVAVLNHLSRTAPADAVLTGWWDVGHWATYWSRRAVAVDGASLRSPRIHAVGRLLAADAAQPLNRLVNEAACGSGSDCGRPVYLLTSDLLLSQQGWMISGFWQPARARLVDELAAGQPPAEVQEPLATAARAVNGGLARSLFAAPGARIWSTGWAPCAVVADGGYHCPLDVTSENGWRIERFVVPGGRVADARLMARPQGGGEAVSVAPSMLRLATPEQLLDLPGDGPQDNPGVLLDTARRRVFLGTPAVLRSLVARLVLLDGRYDRHRFVRVASASTPDGHQVNAWRVRRR